ncbi:restriction endonuclease subunit S [Streptomyces griseoaurantiacus]|uniref:restriction endonuclease subunit S n=1 Tax=Streptomyces griseoaurantiacus TaxID=68213 RepID=UPI00380CC837
MTTGALGALPTPSHWHWQDLWSIAPRVKETGRPDLPALSVYLEAGVVPRTSRNDNHNRLGEDLSRYLVVRPGDIVFNKLRTWQGGLGASRYSGIVSPAYFVCRPAGETNSHFLHYLLRSAPYLAELTRISKWMPPSQFDTPWDQLRKLPILLPPVQEQRRIANFLDVEVARIDRTRSLLTRQQTLIAEAAVRRVYDAVRGTHVKGERKNSGLDWLGTVPADWRVGAVSHYFEVELGKMLNQDRTQGGHLRPYLRVANVLWDEIITTDLAYMDFPPEEQTRYRLRPGDLLVNEGGSWPGRAAIWDGQIAEMYYQKALHRIRARGQELPRWLYYCLVAAERLRVFQIQGNTSTMTHLTREQLRPQRFPFPDIPTQSRLVAELDRAAARNAATQRLLNRQLDLLAERRQALITAAVTGQFDVSTASGRNVTEGVGV